MNTSADNEFSHQIHMDTTVEAATGELDRPQIGGNMNMPHAQADPPYPRLRLIVAAEAFVDVRTVDKVLQGGPPVRPISRERIRAALEVLGWGHLLPALVVEGGDASR
jgi:hypothetical protein